MTNSAFVQGYQTVENLELCRDHNDVPGPVLFATPIDLIGWNPMVLSASEFATLLKNEYEVDWNAVYRWSVANALATSASVDA